MPGKPGNIPSHKIHSGISFDGLACCPVCNYLNLIHYFITFLYSKYNKDFCELYFKLYYITCCGILTVSMGSGVFAVSTFLFSVMLFFIN